MPLMEIHKHVDGTVEIASETPATHIFSDGYVNAAVAEGWIEFTGDALAYEVEPDPLGPMQHAAKLKLKLPGDHLTLHVVGGDVVYRITHPPVPRGFRFADDREPDGIRIAPEYGLELVS